MKSILTIDDSSSVRQMVKFVVSAAGFKVDEADNGRSGLNAARNGRYDMIITDLNMPEMNGLQFITEVRKISSYKGTPIIFLTTESSAELKQKAKEAGASGWLTKPFNQQQLLTIVRKFIG